MRPTLLADTLNCPDLVSLIQSFLHEQLNPSMLSSLSSNDSMPNLPPFNSMLSIYTSAVAKFYAPSDLSGIGGMRFERIHATSNFRGDSRYDCVFVETDSMAPGMRGLDIARVFQFFSFNYRDVFYPCALIRWYSRVGDGPDEDTGMWIVEPQFSPDGSPYHSVIHLDTIIRAAHLLGVCDDEFIPVGIPPSASLDIFHSYFVNKFIDSHAFEVAF
jgi:hypothetical protein